MDWNTRNRRAQIADWQRLTRGGSKIWRAFEKPIAWVGLFGLGLVALWILGWLAGVYWEIAASGFDFGRAALRWLLEMPR